MTAQDARRAALIGEISRDWEMVRRHLERSRSVAPGRGVAESALVALSLDHAYQAFETMLIRAERALGLAPRSGGEWHRAALADAALELPGVRPAIVPLEVERDWDEVRRFRHFLRHAYTVELDAVRLVKVVDHLERAVAATDPGITSLVASLG